MPRPRHRRSAVVALVAVAVAAVGASGPADATAAFDVKARAVAGVPQTAKPGDRLALKWTVTRAGGRVRSGRVTFLLSADGRRSADDRRLATVGKLKALARKRRARGTQRVTVPTGASPGRYRILACVDRIKGRGVKERGRARRNNCRASKAFTVAAPAAVPAPIVPAPAVPGPFAPAPAPAAPPPADPPPGDPQEQDPPPQPVDVQPVLDTERKVVQDVGADGATIEATAADGTRFSLAVPAGALLSTEQVTLTPVASVTGLPMSGGLVGAVDIEPDGLVLQEPAMLTITPPGPVPLEEQTGVLWHAGGEDFHLHPLEPGDPIVLRLTHFSAPGVARGTQADRDAQLARFPEREEDVLAQELGHQTQLERSGKGSQFEAGVASLRRQYTRRVRIGLVRARTSDSLTYIERVIALTSDWRLFAGLDEATRARLANELAESREFMQAVLRQAISVADSRCRQHHDTQAVQRLPWIFMMGMLASVWSSNDVAIRETLERCLSFELDFSTKLKAVGPRGEQHESGREGKGGEVFVSIPRIPLSLSLQDMTLAGGKAFAYDPPRTWDAYPGGNCVRHDGTEYGALFEVFALQLPINLVRGAAKPDMRMRFSHGSSVEHYTLYCEQLVDRGAFSRWIYFATFSNMHSDERVDGYDWPIQSLTGSGHPDPPDRHIFEMREWTLEPPGSPVYAGRSYERSRFYDQGYAYEFSLSEQTLFELRHTPGG